MVAISLFLGFFLAKQTWAVFFGRLFFFFFFSGVWCCNQWFGLVVWDSGGTPKEQSFSSGDLKYYPNHLNHVFYLVGFVGTPGWDYDLQKVRIQSPWFKKMPL